MPRALTLHLPYYPWSMSSARKRFSVYIELIPWTKTFKQNDFAQTWGLPVT